MTSSRKQQAVPASLSLPDVGRKGTSLAPAPLNHVHTTPTDSLAGHLAAEDPHAQYYNDDRGHAEFAVISKGVTNGDSHDHSGGDGAQIDHGGLAGLTDDDHTQYALLAGRSGGQTLKGGTGSGDDLTLVSTNHATKGDVYVGGDGATNRTVVESDGTIRFDGDGTVWEDVNFDVVSSGGPVATRPDDVTINNVFHKEFTSANNQLCGGNKEVPHSHQLSTTLYPHIHIFLKGGESSGTTGVTFTYYWELRQDSGTTSGSVALSATSAELAASPTKLTIYDATGFTGPTSKGANMASTIARTGGNAGDVVVTTFGVHYAIDTVGSRTITTK